jgi:hypothetical protein
MTVDIDQMPAGRDMDKLIAQKIFGWVRLGEIPDRQITSPGCGAPMDAVLRIVPHYSIDIADAWDAARMEAAFSLEHLPMAGNSWYAKFEDRGNGTWQDEVVVHAVASTAPLAICRAALKFVEAVEARRADEH